MTIVEMEAQLDAADKAYYAGYEPLMTDAAYDAMKTALRAAYAGMVPETSVLNRVGSPLEEGVKKAAHLFPMLSLANAFTSEDVEDFWRQVGAGPEDCVYGELKLDGLSLSLLYENHRFVRATTRGDGRVGEDVTNKVHRLGDIPTVLPAGFPATCEIRGEICMTHAVFRALNAQRSQQGQALLSNPRNAAAGYMRRDVDEGITLVFFAYQVAGEHAFATQSDVLEALEEAGFDASPNRGLFATPQEAVLWYEEIARIRASLPVDIDGIVYKIDKTQSAKRLGMRSTSPRWAIAHKFPPDRVWTRINAIDIQVGRTGTLAPVARLEPVTVGGVVVSNATLHNKAYIEGRDGNGAPIRGGVDIRVGDWVEVYRSGDVIPRIGAVDVARRTTSVPFAFPHACPACGGAVIQQPGEAAIKCGASWQCPPQRLRALVYAFSREALNIDGVSESSIEQWLEWGWIQEPADVFSLEDRFGAGPAGLSNKLGWGPVSAKRAFDAIALARKTTMERVLVSLGIPFIGRAASRALGQSYPGFAELLQDAQQHPERLVEIEGFGEKMKDSLVGFLTVPETLEPLQRLLACLEIENPLFQSGGGPLDGWTFVFTGKLEQASREAAAASARALGATVAGSVSAKTTVLVAGPGAGSKLKKAESLGVHVWDEAAWVACVADINNGLPPKLPA